MKSPQRTSVLVADAEPLARCGLVQLINGHPGLKVCAEAASISEARELCAQHRPEILVLDPAQGDGFALIKDLPRWSRSTRVIVLTSLEDTASVQRALQAGALGYVSRRDPVDSLIRAIIEALSGNRHIGPRPSRALFGDLACGSLLLEKDAFSCLSPREFDVFRRIGEGMKVQAIAEEFHLSKKTVETHRQRIREKLHLASGCELQRQAVLFHHSINMAMVESRHNLPPGNRMEEASPSSNSLEARSDISPIRSCGPKRTPRPRSPGRARRRQRPHQI